MGEVDMRVLCSTLIFIVVALSAGHCHAGEPGAQPAEQLRAELERWRSEQLENTEDQMRADHAGVHSVLFARHTCLQAADRVLTEADIEECVRTFQKNLFAQDAGEDASEKKAAFYMGLFGISPAVASDTFYLEELLTARCGREPTIEHLKQHAGISLTIALALKRGDVASAKQALKDVPCPGAP